ncbi:hypothetical protein JOQ06_014131 [Pogonophryne albipinna]|uniref:Uncharacterized protein n=1 Tax=Pogonophryne albipinna TaxID=1090488 RepID=A0AAD6AF48_9TELE|nr:hypothetical protein JOQ06_014131 [Pogonophryne albipinna]
MCVAICCFMFCLELNQGTLPSVRKWKRPRGLWKSLVSEKPTAQSSKGVSFSGFLWDSSSGIELRDAAILESPVANGNPPHCRPYLAHFTVGSYDLTLLTFTCRASLLQSQTEESSHRGHKEFPPRPAGHTQRLPYLSDVHSVEKQIRLNGEIERSWWFWEILALPPLTAGGPEEREALPLLSSSTFTNISTSCPQAPAAWTIWLSRSLRKIYSVP